MYELLLGRGMTRLEPRAGEQERQIYGKGEEQSSDQFSLPQADVGMGQSRKLLGERGAIMG